MLVADLQTFDEHGFRQTSRDLDLLASGDYSPIAAELRRLYPESNLDIRAIPFVERYVAELTGRYARPVVRRFVSASDPSAVVWQKLQEVYDSSNIDQTWSEAERALSVQRSLILLPIPVAMRQVSVLVCRPWQVEVECPDPLRASDPASWTKLTVAVPQSIVGGQVLMGQIVITPQSAWRTVGGRQVGLYDPSGRNPLGRIGAVVLRHGDPYPGKWHGAVNEAVHGLQLVLSTQDADNDYTIRNCAFPQWVLENATTRQKTETISMGPGKVVALIRDADGDGPGPVLRAVQGQVPVSELASNMEAKIRLYCSLLGMDPSSFIRVNTSVTASARLFAAQDRKALRDKVLPVLERGERDLARLIAELLSRVELVQLPFKDLTVSLAYHEAQPSADPLHDAQALELRVRLGLANPADLLASELGIPRSEAVRMVERNLRDARALGLIAEPAPDPAGEVTQ